ncbi:hypothetical protein CAXC1_150030 [Candidatus Xenohaliotis californiensis]|uniref:Uncharacterized protein n=1 Tax=Candidatus Xenohaliotis californiensis TaxID=84677 RepID=A0ABP0ERT4_9RICK|nr:hypothetical protein CAXC1_150030 [Candidatus Xenohaliotis californiensis]
MLLMSCTKWIDAAGSVLQDFLIDNTKYLLMEASHIIFWNLKCYFSEAITEF